MASYTVCVAGTMSSTTTPLSSNSQRLDPRLHRLFTSTIYIDCLHRLRVLLATLSTRILNPRFSSSTVSYDVFLTLSALPVAGHVIDTHFEPHFSSPTASYDM